MEAKLVECVDYCNEVFGTHISGSKQHAVLWQTSFGTISLDAKSAITGPNNQGLHVIILEGKNVPSIRQAAQHAKN